MKTLNELKINIIAIKYFDAFKTNVRFFHFINNLIEIHQIYINKFIARIFLNKYSQDILYLKKIIFAFNFVQLNNEYH